MRHIILVVHDTRHTYVVGYRYSAVGATAVFTLPSIHVAVVQKLRMSHETHPFGASRQGAPIFFLALIATMIASAATITTRLHHLILSAGNTKVLCIGHTKTCCIDCT
jgi:hypothetical protein